MGGTLKLRTTNEGDIMDRDTLNENVDAIMRSLTPEDIDRLARAALKSHAITEANYEDDTTLTDQAKDALADAIPQRLDYAMARYRDDPERGDLAEDIAQANYWRVLIGEREICEDDETGWLKVYA